MAAIQKYILSVDQGTTSSRAIIFDNKGKEIAKAQREFTQFFPQNGWVEHDANEIWETQIAVIKEVVNKVGDSGGIAAIGITNQRETTVVWDKKTGKPIHNAIVWQDRRTAAQCDVLKEKGFDNVVQAKTGLILDAYFSGTKIAWILDNVAGARSRANEGELLFGTVDTWLIYNLTQGKVHVSDVTNASRTMLFNIHNLSWDDELLDILNVPRTMLPEVKASSDSFGTAIIGDKYIPIYGVAGDQQAALFGQLCLNEGEGKNTYGTGCFMVVNTGNKVVKSQHKLLSTIGYQLHGQKPIYALEGSVFVGGAVVQWLRDGLKIIDDSASSEKIALSVPDNGGVYFVPALTGLGAPHWDQYARGSIHGLTRSTTQAHIVRAALESIVYQVDDLLTSIAKDLGHPISALKVDGGATSNDLLMQTQANVSNVTVTRPRNPESTALGVAFLAGLYCHFWKDIDELKLILADSQSFEPNMKDEWRNNKIQWAKAVLRSLNWIEKDE